jgi:hypothetical protein
MIEQVHARQGLSGQPEGVDVSVTGGEIPARGVSSRAVARDLRRVASGWRWACDAFDCD